MSKRLSKLGWIVIIALLTLALVAFPACTQTGEEEEEEENGGPAIPYKNDGIFVQMTIGEPETLDPAASYDNASGEQIDLVYETLVDYDRGAAGDFVGQLATDWVWNAADLTWTFTIRQGVKFHEGGDLSPEDVEYSFERAMIYDRLGGPTWMLFEPLLLAGEYAGLTFADVDATVEVDGNNVVFTLADAGYTLIWLQTICGGWGSIVDKEWCIANGEWDGTEADIPNHYQQEDGTTYLWTHMNGTGPWKLNQWEHGVQFKLERFDDYWREPAPFDFVISQLVEEWTTRKQALLAGDADFVLVDKMYIPEIEGVADLLKIKDLGELAVTSMFMNQDIETEDNDYIGTGQLDGNGIPGDFFSDPDVRKGFLYAFDYETAIRDIMLDEGITPPSPIVEGLLGYNPDASRYTYDLAKAEEHLKAAWGGQVWEKGFKFTAIYNSGNDMRKAAMEILAENLFEINNKFQVAVVGLPWGTGMVPLLRSYRLVLYACGWGGDYPHAHNFVAPFMSTYGTFSKFMSYGSAELDATIEAALLELDPEEQLDKYYELQQIWYDDAPAIMCWQPTGRRWFTKYIHGFFFNPMIPGDAGPLYYMSKSAS
ncbi:MAG: ABC transporter substrate-binding protein [Dehalococcoidia bacterium]|nr:ABC transporter substrate-binding protein [Dehalococcoidia bacterium]MDH4291323.1 ABC transporter substrate-binding protein [Dehalococcoidia bacterium]